MKKANSVKKNECKKTWLELKPEELRKLSAKSACMYGKKAQIDEFN